MTRKEFIKYLLNKLIKPILYSGLLIWVIFIFRESLKNNNYSINISSFILILCAFILGLLIVLGIIRLLFDTIWKNVPENIQIKIKKINTYIDYLFIPFTVYLLYIAWQKDKVGTITFLIYMLISYLVNKTQTKQI